jgi:ubiquinone/menaquinone biosynthesis C-methylase UbiE
VADACFAEPRLVGIYDALDADRSDLDAYLEIVEEFAARSVLDIGCGTGSYVCLLARRGIGVFGFDPAAASLEVARRKPGADKVSWIHGDVSALPPLDVDMVTMTGNVAQVFITDDQWAAVLATARRVLGSAGVLVFETRDPTRKSWQGWTRQRTERRVQIPGVGAVRTWTELTQIALPLVSFRATFVFEADGSVLTSESTLRFWQRDEIERSLRTAGFAVQDVRDAPDRPGLEMVFVARPADTADTQREGGVWVRFESARSDVHRRGPTVVRAAGPWTRSVHALLRHLESVGFDGSPRVVRDGFDSEGREVLSYIDGDFVHPHAWTDDGIVALGHMLRRFHDAAATFATPTEVIWQPWFTRSTRPDAICGHGDLGPWNIVARRGLPVGFIDWEFAGPLDRLDEVAQVAWLNAQLHDDDVAARNQLPPAADRARQLGLFADAYRLAPAERAELVTRMIEHAVRDAANELTDTGGLKMAKAPDGPADPGWAVAWRLRSAAWLIRHRPLLQSALTP